MNGGFPLSWKAQTPRFPHSHRTTTTAALASPPKQRHNHGCATRYLPDLPTDSSEEAKKEIAVAFFRFANIPTDVEEGQSLWNPNEVQSIRVIYDLTTLAKVLGELILIDEANVSAFAGHKSSNRSCTIIIVTGLFRKSEGAFFLCLHCVGNKPLLQAHPALKKTSC
jgi:hypothetical protein